MNAINKLGLKVVVFVTLVVLVTAGVWWGLQQWLESRPEPEQVDPQTDTDADGLPDLFEGYYQTDPANPDTDGDGTTDFNELLEGRDPTQGVEEESDEVTLPTGDNVLNTETLTGKYLASLPTDLERIEILESSRVEAFIDEHRESLLVPLPADTVKSEPGEGKEAVSAYLDAISSSHNSDLIVVNDTRIEQALTEQLQLNNEPMEQLVADLEHNFDTLAAVVAPSEVVNLHELVLTATAQLRDNVRLLRDINDDFMAGLAASKNVDALGESFIQIAEHVAGLEEKYGIE